MSRTLLGLAVALALTTPAYAQSHDLVELREEIKRMKQDYESRIRVLEERLQTSRHPKRLSNPWRPRAPLPVPAPRRRLMPSIRPSA